MKKLFTILGCIALFALTTSTVKAQNYKTGVGLAIDFGDGSTLVGPHIKHFFTENNVGEADVLFASGVTFIQALYEYHAPIQGASGLKWYAGVGPGVALYRNDSEFYLRPLAGLDYKIGKAPLAASFDWRPVMGFNDGVNFEAARFGLGLRFTF
ncbi:hypothetical protein [Pedobacter aquatilis]|uniref:hypothetical protein n=1 Tax=Pedobacter aquatilis TaxID=351343 RepID=UPI002930368E|nr:hypothetical protein [Pedobacter aquatilis]